MRKVLTLAIFVLLFSVLVACGNSEEPTTTPADDDVTETENTDSNAENEAEGTEASADAQEVTVVASNFEFDQDAYTVSSGEVTINLENADGHHGIAVVGTDVMINGAGSETVQLEPGEYRIECSIPCGNGHKDMVATLVVE
ncbi:cytochrome C oxidase subunit II [Caldalkalibacillus salinus]|uniref:cytochrome C oxidase subunit II n=1 Tax=Caldalkalibacillus salinus TaxID=2803787 RepID=UPI0019242637|nr:cytochrome C oxidase subunit II [Caldalkalibacillus salinus]